CAARNRSGMSVSTASPSNSSRVYPKALSTCEFTFVIRPLSSVTTIASGENSKKFSNNVWVGSIFWGFWVDGSSIYAYAQPPRSILYSPYRDLQPGYANLRRSDPVLRLPFLSPYPDAAGRASMRAVPLLRTPHQV